MPRHHSTGVLTTGIYLPKVLEAGGPSSRTILGETPLSGLQLAAFALCCHRPPLCEGTLRGRLSCLASLPLLLGTLVLQS